MILFILRQFLLTLGLRLRVLRAAALSVFKGDITPVGRLYARVIRSNGDVENLGLISTKVVTDAGVQYLVDALQNLVEPENFKYHASGTGTTAEAASQTALVTEVASRTAGSQAEGASANIYRTVAIIAYAAPFAITEHGVFSANAAGTMLDRSLFAAINVLSGDSIEFTYDLTLPSGS
jgi:hypothetical protein